VGGTVPRGPEPNRERVTGEKMSKLHAEGEKGGGKLREKKKRTTIQVLEKQKKKKKPKEKKLGSRKVKQGLERGDGKGGHRAVER